MDGDSLAKRTCTGCVVGEAFSANQFDRQAACVFAHAPFASRTYESVRDRQLVGGIRWLNESPKTFEAFVDAVGGVSFMYSKDAWRT